MESFPNIYGEFIDCYFSRGANFNGTFYPTQRYEDNLNGAEDSYMQYLYSVSFSANRSNELYGKSDTIQPNAFRTLYIIRYEK